MKELANLGKMCRVQDPPTSTDGDTMPIDEVMEREGIRWERENSISDRQAVFGRREDCLYGGGA